MRIQLVVNLQKKMIMGTHTLYKCFLTGGFLLAMSLTGLANDNKPYYFNSAFADRTILSVTDTVPPQENKKVEENKNSKPEEVIKEVPKSRKQVKPLALTTAVKVKPVIVKPKIVVKPIIKLH
jgi:hypothetical protein